MAEDIYHVTDLGSRLVESESAGQSKEKVALYSFKTANKLKYYIEVITYENTFSVYSFRPNINKLKNKMIAYSMVVSNKNEIEDYLKNTQDYLTLLEFNNKIKVNDSRKILRTAFSVLFKTLHSGKTNVAIFTGFPKFIEKRYEKQSNTRFRIYLNILQRALDQDKFLLKIERRSNTFFIMNKSLMNKYNEIIEVANRYYKEIADLSDLEV